MPLGEIPRPPPTISVELERVAMVCVFRISLDSDGR